MGSTGSETVHETVTNPQFEGTPKPTPPTPPTPQNSNSKLTDTLDLIAQPTESKEPNELIRLRPTQSKDPDPDPDPNLSPISTEITTPHNRPNYLPLPPTEDSHPWLFGPIVTQPAIVHVSADKNKGDHKLRRSARISVKGPRSYGSPRKRNRATRAKGSSSTPQTLAHQDELIASLQNEALTATPLDEDKVTQVNDYCGVVPMYQSLMEAPSSSRNEPLQPIGGENIDYLGYVPEESNIPALHYDSDDDLSDMGEEE